MVNGLIILGSSPGGEAFRTPLLPVFLLVGGGFCVFGITVFYGGLQRFTVVHVVEMHWRFSPRRCWCQLFRNVTTNTRQPT